MRVAVFFPGFTGGGVETMMPTLAWGLRGCGLEVDVIVKSSSGGDAASELDLTTYSLRSNHTLLAIPRLIRYLIARKPDVLISGPVITNLAAVAACRLVRRRPLLILTERGNLSLDVGIEHAGNLKMQIVPHLMRLLYPLADGIIAPSSAPFADPLFKATVNLDLIPHAVIPNPLRQGWRPYSPPPQNQRELSPTNAPPTIVAVGRLAEQKGFDVLLHAIASLIQCGITVRAVILGEGPRRAMLNNLASELGISNLVSMPGYVPDPYPHIANADAFIMPSRWEAFGNAKVEAMACRKPMVLSAAAANGGGNIADGVNALVVPVDDAVALAEAIRRILIDPQLAAMLADNAWRTSRDFTPAATAERYIAFIREVINSKRLTP